MATDDPDNDPVAPLPPHERPWRHPSELARAERAAANIPPPPLNRIVAGIALGVAAGLSILLVVLALPRTSGREDLPRTLAATSTTIPAASRHTALGVAALDLRGRTYLLPVAALPPDLFAPGSRARLDSADFDSVFVSATHALDGNRPIILTTPAGSLIPLETTYRDPRTGLSLLRSALRVRTPTARVAVGSRSVTSAGTTMVLHGRTEHRVKVGLRVATTGSESFVPVEVDAVVRNFVDAAPVTDVDGHFAGLFVHRDDAVGVVPVSAIVSFVERALQSSE